jgi:protease IV
MATKESSGPIGRLFGFIWTLVITAYRVAIVVSFVVFAVLLWFAWQGGKPIVVEDNIALVIAPSGALVEQLDREPGQQFLEEIAGEPPSQSLLRDAISALEKGAADPKIAFAVIKLDGLDSAGLPQMQELGTAIDTFRASGKKVVAYGPWYDQIPYYAAARADEVVMDPMGFVAVEGFSLYNNYFKEGLDKLGIEINVFRVGDYKSAVEPFTRNDMSAEARQANLEWLQDLWKDFGEGVAAARGLTAAAADDYVNALREGMDRNGGDAAGYARDKGLITHVETLREFRARMAEQVGFDEDHGSFRQIHYLRYLRALAQRPTPAAAAPARIALVVVQGDIVDGPGQPGMAGGETVAGLLDDARRDPDVAAVVLRVDSPGGSVWASEQIRRQVQHLRDEGKPVIASMGNVAASGGYWVSMDADEIWAHDSTITGSIGIFGLIPTVQKPLQKMGIHTDGVGTTRLAGTLRLDRPISPEWSSIIQSEINKGYRDFIDGVAAARKLPVERVNEIARGRVWSGADAKALGLVDQIGNLDQAVQAAARLARLQPDSYTLEDFSPERSWTGNLLDLLGGSIHLDPTSGLSAWARQWLTRGDLGWVLQRLNDPRGMYAHCFCSPAGAGRPR